MAVIAVVPSNQTLTGSVVQMKRTKRILKAKQRRTFPATTTMLERIAMCSIENFTLWPKKVIFSLNRWHLHWIGCHLIIDRNNTGRLPYAPSLSHLPRASSMHALAANSLNSQQKKVTPKIGTDRRPTKEAALESPSVSLLQDCLPSYGLFEASQIACPVLPQYHPQQLMELLNSGTSLPAPPIGTGPPTNRPFLFCRKNALGQSHFGSPSSLHFGPPWHEQRRRR